MTDQPTDILESDATGSTNDSERRHSEGWVEDQLQGVGDHERLRVFYIDPGAYTVTLRHGADTFDGISCGSGRVRR